MEDIFREGPFCPIFNYMTKKRTSYFGKHAEFETEREANIRSKLLSQWRNKAKYLKVQTPLSWSEKKIIKYVKISHPSLTHNDKFDKEGYTITLCFRSSALVRSMAVWWALDQKG